MKKFSAFTIVEIVVVFCLILLTATFVVPELIKDNKKLNTIAQWKHSYQNIDYVFSAIRVNDDKNDRLALEQAKNDNESIDALFTILNPYIRIKSDLSEKDYKIRFYNGKIPKTNNIYYFNKFKILNSGHIVGLKWLNDYKNSDTKTPYAMMLFDINGIDKPNTWGEDIFAVKVFKDRIEPVGNEFSNNKIMIKRDCSKYGLGIACSYYYNVYGGSFTENER